MVYGWKGRGFSGTDWSGRNGRTGKETCMGIQVPMLPLRGLRRAKGSGDLCMVGYSGAGRKKVTMRGKWDRARRGAK